LLRLSHVVEVVAGAADAELAAQLTAEQAQPPAVGAQVAGLRLNSLFCLTAQSVLLPHASLGCSSAGAVAELCMTVTDCVDALQVA
jgi:hypothetical protein